MIPTGAIIRSIVRPSVNKTFTRNLTAIPPRVRVSFAEKVCHGLAITVGVTFTPIWIIVHLDDYKHKK